MATITETELQKRLRKAGTGGGSSGPTAVRRGDTWEYSEDALYLAYASNITGATSAGIISNQSDAVGFQFSAFTPSGALLPWRGYLFSKSMYASGDPTDYIWEDISANASGTSTMERYYSTHSGLLVDMGNPDYPGTRPDGTDVPWISISVSSAIPDTAFFLAERYTINGVTSSWNVYAIATDELGFGLIPYTITGRNKPALNSTQWNDDAILAVSAYTGLSYSTIKELGYGTTVVITYDDGKLYGMLKKISGVATWVAPIDYIDGALLVDTSIVEDKITAGAITTNKIAANAITTDLILSEAVTTDKVAANSITSGKIVLTGSGAIDSSTIGAITTFAQATAPTAVGVGDLWTDTDDGNRIYRWDGTSWVNQRDTTIAAAAADATQALSDASSAQALADSKIDTFYQASMPGGSTGDLWIDTDDGNKLYRHNGTTFIEVQDGAIADALSDAAQGIADAAAAQGTADGKVQTFYQNSAPTGMTSTDVGDLWVDTDDNNKMYRYSGTSWVSIRDTDYTNRVLPADVADAINDNTTTIDGSKITTGTISASNITTGYLSASRVAAGIIYDNSHYIFTGGVITGENSASTYNMKIDLTNGSIHIK